MGAKVEGGTAITLVARGPHAEAETVDARLARETRCMDLPLPTGNHGRMGRGIEPIASWAGCKLQ